MDPRKKMPIRIDNDGLANAIVILTYSSNYNREYIESRIQTSLNAVFKTNFQKVMMPRPITVEGEVIDHFIANRDFRIQVTKSMININIVKNYIGWSNYSSLILALLDSLEEAVIYHVAQVRYMSLFDEISIFEELDGKFKFEYIPVFFGTQLNFRCNAHDENKDMHCVISVKVTDKAQVDDRLLSIVEICAETNMGDADRKTAYSYLDFLHYNEKQMFFTLLKDSFINQHNPVYE